jgi:hypothetical protein
LAWSLWYEARDGKAVRVKDLQRLAGRLQSMKLALEGVAEWTRGLYADITCALTASQQRPQRHQMVLHLREPALSDLNFWAYRLGKQNGLAINDSGSEMRVTVTVHSDASDVGYGAHCGVEGSEVSGNLPVEMLGCSSTAREIKGVMMAAERMAEQLEGQRVRICMDSYPAIRNFINGGGPKEDLNAMVKEWWIWCKVRRVTPLYLWIPREDNSLADELSKQAALTPALKPEAEQAVRKWLTTLGEPGMDRNHWLQTRVQCPLFDRIAIRVQEMRRSRRPACIVVPTWRSAVWRAELHAYSTLIPARPSTPIAAQRRRPARCPWHGACVSAVVDRALSCVARCVWSAVCVDALGAVSVGGLYVRFSSPKESMPALATGTDI